MPKLQGKTPKLAKELVNRLTQFTQKKTLFPFNYKKTKKKLPSDKVLSTKRYKQKVIK